MVEILYSDNHLLVLNKPANLLTQPSERENHSLQLLAKEWIKREFHKPGECFLEPIHRLDRPVSGIVLFARTSKALSRLNEQLRRGLFQKKYIAIVEGTLATDQGQLEHYLKRSSFHTQVCAHPTSDAKKALLNYQVIRRFPQRTCLTIDLLTGRYHQIRAQLCAIGHPIIGDTKYGSTINSETLFLHHMELSFSHPTTNNRMQIVAPLPCHWEDLSQRGLNFTLDKSE